MLKIFQVSEKDEQELRRMIRQEKGAVVLRAQLIWWAYHDQPSIPPLARRMGWTEGRVRHWIHRFLAEGPQGLYDRPGRGRPSKQTGEMQQGLSKHLDAGRPPEHTGYTCWTIALLVSWLLVTFRLQVHPSTVRRWIHQEFHWQRPQTDPGSGDPQKEAKLQRIQQVLDTRKALDVVLYEDETTVRLLPPIRGMWMRIGHQVRIPTGSGWNKSFKVFGVLDAHTGRWIYRIFDKCNAQNFITFLEGVLEAHPEGKLYLILDRAPWHRAHLVEAWVDTHPRIEVVWLPTGSPKLNPVERIWRRLKDQVAANYWYGTLNALRTAAEHFLDSLSPEDASRIARLAA